MPDIIDIIQDLESVALDASAIARLAVDSGEEIILTSSSDPAGRRAHGYALDQTERLTREVLRLSEALVRLIPSLTRSARSDTAKSEDGEEGREAPKVRQKSDTLQ